jgi:hypothetical protein
MEDPAAFHPLLIAAFAPTASSPPGAIAAPYRTAPCHLHHAFPPRPYRTTPPIRTIASVNNKGLSALLHTAACVLAVVRLAAVDHYVKRTTETVNTTFDRARQKQEDQVHAQREARDAAKAAAAEEKRRQLEVACYVVTPTAARSPAQA